MADASLEPPSFVQARPGWRASTATTRAGAGRSVVACKDTAIYLEGDPAREWFEVEWGVVMTCRYLPSGDRQVTGFFQRGQLFGIDYPSYRATAEAVTDVILIGRPQLEPGHVAHEGEQPHPLGLALRNAEERIELLVRKGARARVAAFLLTHAVEEGGVWAVELPMRRADIADYLTIDVATVSRVFTRFVEQRLLSPRQGQAYRIEDVEGLRGVCGEEATELDGDPATPEPEQPPRRLVPRGGHVSAARPQREFEPAACVVGERDAARGGRAPQRSHRSRG